jgi:hypothetical protein
MLIKVKDSLVQYETRFVYLFILISEKETIESKFLISHGKIKKIEPTEGGGGGGSYVVPTRCTIA